MRYNSIERLEHWQQTGKFPDIHRDIGAMVLSYMQGERVLDLCCSYGLLGQRILKQCGAKKVVGVDCEDWVVKAAREAGIGIEILEMKITRATFDRMLDFLKEHQITVLVARRCISEVFVDDLEWAPEFAEAMRRIGIREVFLEGRAIVAKATHPIPTVVEEVACFAGSYREVKRVGQCSYMVAR